MTSRIGHAARAILLVAVGAVVPATAGAQGASRDSVPVTLEDAVGRATDGSEEIRLARSQVALARAQVRAAKAGAYPQLSAQLGYTRTFASAFSGGGGFTLPDSLKFEPDSSRPLAERVAYLEDKVPDAALGSLGSLFGNLPFGQKNTYTASISGSQGLYSGGRLGAGLRIADHFLEGASFTLQEETAEIVLQVRSAYFRARLGQELVGIARAAVEQAERFLQSERVRHDAGTASELDVLRAEVSLANLQPPLVSATSAAEVATLDLKRLINVPLNQPVRLTTSLDVPSDLGTANTSDATEVVSQRPAIAAEERQLRIREEQVRIARSAFMPSLNLVVNLGRQLFPTRILALNQDWRTDFTAGLSATVPLFNGGRTAAEVAQAQVAVDQQRLRLSRLREDVQVEYVRARGERERARAAIQARQRTVGQAQRVYDLTVLRYQESLASQLEVSDARLSLLQARTNLAQAVADFHIASATLSRALGVTTPPR